MKTMSSIFLYNVFKIPTTYLLETYFDDSFALTYVRTYLYGFRFDTMNDGGIFYSLY